MFSTDFKNTFAKIIILFWIVTLIAVAFLVARTAISFDLNQFFGIDAKHTYPLNIVQEAQVILLMLSVSIVGGVAFMIKDFYRAVKYLNLYTVAYHDYRAGQMKIGEFQRLITVEIYTGRFNYTWIYWFFIQPILSSTLGVIAFFIARSGLGVIQGSSATPDISIQSIYLYAVFTFLAGFSSHKFIAWLDRLADKIFSTTIPEKVMEQKTQVAAAASIDREELRKDISPNEWVAQVFETEAETGKVVQEATEIIHEPAEETGFARKNLEKKAKADHPATVQLKTVR